MIRSTITAILLTGAIGMLSGTVHGTEPVTELYYSAVIAPGTIDDLPLENQQHVFIAREHIFNFMHAVGNRNIATAEAMISPHADPELTQHIKSLIETTTVLEFHQIINSVSVTHPERIEMKGPFSASGMTMRGTSWNVQGLSIRYTFENVNGDWMISDTNIHKRLETESLGRFFLFLSLGLLPIILVSLLITAFWIWMIIDVAKRPIDDKTLWILIIILGGLIGAIVYFFIPRRKHKQLSASQSEAGKPIPPSTT